MIISRTPTRIPLGGGGTDLPAYSSRYGGFLLSAAINKYVYICVNKRFERSIRVSYSRTEIAERVDEIQHPIVREALRLLGLDGGIEIVSIADVPSNTGLGSSSSFTVGLLNALHCYKRERLDPQSLAEEAYHIEAEILGEPVGKQDQYLAAFGGITCLQIATDGTVNVTTLALSPHVVHELESNLILFYTGIRRSAGEVLKLQGEAVSSGELDATAAMHRIKSIGLEIKMALEAGDTHRFGELMHLHWEAKKHLGSNISTDSIDRWYEIARRHGAVGGKIMGAGGGGFLALYSDNGHDKLALRSALEAEGLQEARVTFDFDGSKISVNL